MTQQDPLWISVFGLMMLTLVLVGSCQAYRDCVADGRPRLGLSF